MTARGYRRAAHVSLALAWAIIAAVALHLGAAGGGCRGRTELNHSGVAECIVGPYTGPMPIDTTNGADIDLSTPWRG